LGCGADQKIPPPNHKRIAQMAITTKQKLRPLLLLDAKPNAAPTPAIRMMNQLSQPSKGMNPIIAKTRAISPNRKASMLAIASFLGAFAIGYKCRRIRGRYSSTNENQLALNRNGKVFNPPTKVELARLGSPANSTVSNRSSNSSNKIRISSRARCNPKH
jgi:hypothetical protein